MPDNVILFPVQHQQDKSSLEDVIDKAMSKVPAKDREKLKFELIKTIDGYDSFFTEWTLKVPKDCGEDFKKQIYDIARQEHERKMLMLADIIKLKIEALVNEYFGKG